MIVPAFGEEYLSLAHERALPSIARQSLGAAEVILAEGQTVSSARNNGAKIATAEWLLFVDADDEIEPGYIAAMSEGSADLRGPATIFLKPGGIVEGPLLVPARPLEDSNYLVIGTMLRREMFWRAGGFREFPVHEDYDLWLRCERRCAATIEQLPDAVYVVHVREHSRNDQSQMMKRRTNARIKATA